MEELIDNEGKRSHPYRDSKGIWTCGVGWNMQETEMCEAAIIAQLNYQINIALKDAKILFPNFASLPEVVKIALADMAFNLGRGRLSSFVKMRRAISKLDYQAAAMEALDSIWAKDVGSRAYRIAHAIESGGT